MTKSIPAVLAALLVSATVLLTSCENNAEVAHGVEPEPYMSITPAYSVLNTNDTVVSLTVEAGTPPFAWTTSDATLGGLSPTSGVTRTVNYTRTANKVGINIITVTDDGGEETTATVTQTVDSD